MTDTPALQRVSLALTPAQIAAIDRQRTHNEPRSVWIRRLIAKEISRSKRRLDAKEMDADA